jgi:toxin ParE1/3/4
LALQDFDEAQDYIAKDNPLAAQAMAQRIADAARRLLDNPEIGRPGHVAGTREWIVTRT